MATVEETFTPVQLLQIWRGLWNYKLTRIKQWSWYANRIENILKENRERLRDGYIDLNKSGALLNVRDPENWIRYDHLPTEVEKMKIYHQFVELVAPEYLTAGDDANKYMAAGDVFSQFTKIGENSVILEAAKEERIERHCYAQALTLQAILEAKNIYRFMAFKKIAGSQYLMAYRFELDVTLEDIFGKALAYKIRNSKQKTKDDDVPILSKIREHFSNLSAKQIGHEYSLSNLQIGILAPYIGTSGAFHGILQTIDYKPNHVDLKSHDSQHFYLIATEGEDWTIPYKRVKFEGINDFLVTLGGPVL